MAVGSLAALLAANLALLAAYGGFITTYAPLATTSLGWSIVEVGIAFSFFGLGSILLGPALAHLADRIGRRTIAIARPAGDRCVRPRAGPGAAAGGHLRARRRSPAAG